METITKRLCLTEYDIPSNWEDQQNINVNEVILKLNEHIGNTAIPRVHLGDKVQEGQKIAETPPNKIGTVIHSPIDGRIRAISESDIRIQNH